MARPIRWDNVQVPDGSDAIRAFDSGADRISQSISDLRALAQEQTAVNQANYENQKNNNTQNIIDQLNRATSRDALSGVNTDQFGNQVDRGAINQAFTGRQDTIVDREAQTARQDLEQQKFNNLIEQQKINNDRADRQLQLDQRKVNQYGFRYEGGQIFRENPNTGKVEPVGTYTVPTKTTNTSTGVAQQKNLLSSSLTSLETLHSFGGDVNAYGDFLTTKLAERSDLSAAEKNKVREDAVKFHEEYYNTWTPSQRTSFETQQRYGQQALKQAEGEFNAMQETASQALGARPEVFAYDKDDSLSVEQASKLHEDAFGWWGSSGKERLADLYQTASETLGKAPTGKEFDYFLTKARSENNYVSGSNMADVVNDYKALIGDGQKRSMAHKVLNLMDNANAELMNQISKNEGRIIRKVRSGKASNMLPALEAAPYDVEGTLAPLREQLKKLK